ncbi:MAG: hypothetical protein ABI091_31215 [Ferruginibacter sp.]
MLTRYLYGREPHQRNWREKSVGSQRYRHHRTIVESFLKLVIISFVIASPIAYFSMYKWLQEYTYRIDIQWWAFAIAGLLSVVITIATVSYQAIKAAMSNPVKSLRTE